MRDSFALARLDDEFFAGFDNGQNLFLIMDIQVVLRDGIRPKFQQFLLAHFTEFGFAD